MSTSPESGTGEEQAPITITDSAKTRILQVMQGKGLVGHNLRVGIQGRGPNGFQYGMTFEGPESEGSEDIAVDAGAFKILLDANSVRHAHGSKIDYTESESGGSFQIENPNPAWDDPRAQTIQQLCPIHI